MKILLTGGAKNGKSHIAQDLCRRLSSEDKRFYIATMIPHDEEDLLRIKKHIADRNGLNFRTLECGIDIKNAISAVQAVGGGSCILLDSITALLANEMFLDGNVNMLAGSKVAQDLVDFAKALENAVFVSDGIYSDSFLYDEITESYRQGLALCEKKLASVCDCVIEMVCGVPVFHKGKAKVDDLYKSEREDNSDKNIELIIGGAHQGKLLYALEHFNLTENDVFYCKKGSLPDFSKKCIVDIQNYIWFCIKNNMPYNLDFSDGSIIIADDIFCGVVPMDSFERKWREECGIYLQKVASKASLTRVICGIPQKIN